MNAKPVVVDASVAIKWYVSESLAENALGVIRGFGPLLAPELILSEVGHTLLKKERGHELTASHCQRALASLVSELSFQAVVNVSLRAFDIAHGHGRSVYDSLYVALALREGCQFVTADERLYNALKDALAGTMLWLGDVPA